MMSYDNSIFNISDLIFSTLVFRYRVLEPFSGILSCKTGKIFSIELAIDIVTTFEFCHEIMIQKMTIFDEVNYIEIEPALGSVVSCINHSLVNFVKNHKTSSLTYIPLQRFVESLRHRNMYG